MHFAHVVLIDPKDLGEQFAEADIEKKVERMMAPYDWNLKVAPYRDYLDSGEVERMVSHYRTHDLTELAVHMQDWDNMSGGVDEKGLYRVSMRNPKRKWDWWRIGGRWDGVISDQPKQSEDGGFNFSPVHEQLPGNVVLLKAIVHEIDCHSLVTPDGEWHELKSLYQTTWKAPYQGDQLTEEQRAANRTAWREENDRLKTEWCVQRRDIFATYGHCLAVQVDYHR